MENNTDIAAAIPSNPQSKDFAYASIEEYESLVGFKVNESFRIGWEMSRITNAQLGISSE